MIRPLTGREQKVLVACLATVVSCLFYRMIVAPLRAQADVIRQQISISQKQLEADGRIVRKAEALDDRHKAYTRHFRQPGTAEETISSMLQEIEHVTGGLGLHVEDLKPKEPEQNPYGHWFFIRLTMRGKFLDMVHFLYELQRQPYFFHVEKAEFEVLAGEERETVMARLVLGKSFVPGSLDAKGTEEDADLGNFPVKGMPFGSMAFEEYSRKIQEKGLFSPFPDKLSTDALSFRKTLPVLHERIRLIGILLDGDSKAVVEDLQDRQTRILSMGESIGAAFLKDIHEDRVIFVYNDEQVEMAL